MGRFYFYYVNFSHALISDYYYKSDQHQLAALLTDFPFWEELQWDTSVLLAREAHSLLVKFSYIPKHKKI